MGPPRVDDTTVELRAVDGTSYALNATDATSTEELATFVGTGVQQAITLSRALEARETLTVVEQGETDVLGSSPVFGPELYVGYVEAGDGSQENPSRGESLKFLGVGFTGQETVEIEDGDTWIACTILSSTTKSLTAEIPLTLDVDDVAELSVRVRNDDDGVVFLRSVIIRE